MNQPPHNTSHVRRVVLPSGRAIEVVYFDSQSETSTSMRSDARHHDLHRCQTCEKELVYPVEWEESSTTHWEVLLRCPNCEWSAVGVYDQATVDRFDEELDRGTEALVRDLRQLTQANMEDEIKRFANALESDAIWPMDF